jgi:hypothetical protein
MIPSRLSRTARLAPIALVLASCLGGPDRLAGNGSEVENAVVAGRVVLSNGAPAEGAAVSLYPSDFNAVNEAALDTAYTVRTDSNGTFRLRGVRGTYNLWGHRRSDGSRFLIQGVQVDSLGKAETGVSTLRRPGILRVTLPEGSEGGYVFVPGTPIARAVDGAADSNGILRVDSVPACRLKAIVFGRKGKPNLDRVLATDVLVEPGAVTDVPFTDWAYSASIRVNGAAAASGTAGRRVTGIPVLLRLPSSGFDFSKARGDGADLRFAKENGAVLPVHVQSWDSAGGTAAVWIRMDTVFADTAPHRIRMYWGNPRATSAERGGGAVFDSADGYVGAWHLDRLDAKAAGGGAVFNDAAVSGDPADPMGVLARPDSAPAIGPADGRIGGGLPLNGSDAWIRGSREYAGPAEFTLSFWFRTGSRQGGKMAGFVMPGLKGASYGNKPGDFNFDRVVWMTDDGLLHAGFTMKSSNYPAVLGYWQSFTAAKAYNDGQWHHLSYTLWDSGAMLVVDGVKVAGYTGLVRPLPVSGHWRIGYCGLGMWDPEWTSEYFQGSIDEVRLIHRSRSEDWLRLDYESQKPDSKFLTLEK